MVARMPHHAFKVDCTDWRASFQFKIPFDLTLTGFHACRSMRAELIALAGVRMSRTNVQDNARIGPPKRVLPWPNTLRSIDSVTTYTERWDLHEAR